MWEQMIDELRRRQSLGAPMGDGKIAKGIVHSAYAPPEMPATGDDGAAVSPEAEAAYQQAQSVKQNAAPMGWNFMSPAAYSGVEGMSGGAATIPPNISYAVQTQTPPANRSKYDPPTAAETTDLWNYMNQRDRQLQWDQAAPRRAMMEFQSGLEQENMRRMRDYMLQTGQTDTVEGRQQKELEQIKARGEAARESHVSSAERDLLKINESTILDMNLPDSAAIAAKDVVAKKLSPDFAESLWQRRLAAKARPKDETGRPVQNPNPTQSLEGVLASINANTDVEAYLNQMMPTLAEGGAGAKEIQARLTKILKSRPNLARGNKPWVGPTGVEHLTGSPSSAGFVLNPSGNYLPIGMTFSSPEDKARYLSSNPREALPMDEYKRLLFASAAYDRLMRQQMGK